MPNVELARDAGLAVSNGIAVNEYLETERQKHFRHRRLRGISERFRGWARIRLESVQNAADQAQCVAMTIAGHRTQYNSLPWFWTDQYEIKLQMAGISAGHDRVVTRGNAEARKLSVFYFHDGKLIAVDSINRPVDHMIGGN